MIHVELRSPAQIHRARRASGFSLLELMVALGVGAIAITSIYAVGSSTTRQFQRQEQLATTQTALRFAMNQLKRDIARAGYLSTPNVEAFGAPQTCGNIPAALHTADIKLAAFSQFVDNEPPADESAIKPNESNESSVFTVDRVSLIGNYETTAEYAGIELLDPPDTITVPMEWHAFRRDFTNWYEANPGVYQAEAFTEVFKVGRMIRIQTTQRMRHFAVITGVTSVAGQRPRITFAPEVPDICRTVVNNGWVAPLSVIELSVRDRVSDTATAEATGPVGQLMRREMQPEVGSRAKLLRMGSLADDRDNVNSRSILDFVVAFNLQFTMNRPNTGAGAADDYEVGVSEINALTVNAAPERIRSVLIDLGVRAPYQDSSRAWSLKNCENMRCFRVFEDRPGSAPVRRMRTEVFVPNLAYEGY